MLGCRGDKVPARESPASGGRVAQGEPMPGRRGKLSRKGLWEKESRVYWRIVASEGLPTKRPGGWVAETRGFPTRSQRGSLAWCESAHWLGCRPHVGPRHLSRESSVDQAASSGVKEGSD